MGEPKPFASLTSSLLARKGAAAPAMRRQMSFNHDDLGWNDMGHDVPARVETRPATTGLTPMGQLSVAAPVVEPAPAPAATPAVVEQQRMLEETIAPRVAAKRDMPVAQPRKAKAAFTLRLDAERHLRLRLASAVSNRSAQQIVTEALDALLATVPGLEALAEKAGHEND
jgi:hypothetical protein